MPAPVRLFIVSHAPPLPSWGGSMTFYRHFVERDDFEVCVASNSTLFDDYQIPYRPVEMKLPRLWARGCRTRFMPWLNGLQDLWGSALLQKEVVDAAIDFQPDAVFTVAGSWDWTALAARKIANRLKVPLVASFNDWFNYGWFPCHKMFHSRIESRFFDFYQQADLALCTSEGMKESLGPHKNAHVWYPTGAPMENEEPPYQVTDSTPLRPFTVFFGGSLGDWYGKMIESLVTECRTSAPDIRFRIFGSLESWSDSFGDWAKAEGVFGGRVSFEQLRHEAKQADLLLLPMGFGDECAHVEKTSFKTKFLDYLSFRRPILTWGPEYCSAVRTAREFDSAECVTVNDAAKCATVIRELAGSSQRRTELMANAQAMYESRFHPDRIHEGLVREIRKVCKKFSGKQLA